MTYEREICVSKLFLMSKEIDGLCVKLETNSSQDLIERSRNLLNQTQMFIDNNRSIIPPYILKKVSESMRRLEKNANGPDKCKLTFKFNSKPSRPGPKATIEETVAATPHKSDQISDIASTGFKDKTGEELALGSREIDSKDVSLVNLDGCNVRLSGLASTVYVRGLKNSTVTICLACRAITVRDCKNCEFRFVCQQLRIDSTTDCRFQVFTSARSMLESSTKLTFARLNPEEIITNIHIDSGQLKDLFERANFNRLKNNWNCIDDFDWLSPDEPSRNFSLCDSTEVDR